MSERVAATELQTGDTVTIDGRRAYVVGAVPTSDAETLLVLMVTTETEFQLAVAGDQDGEDEQHNVPRWW